MRLLIFFAVFFASSNSYCYAAFCAFLYHGDFSKPGLPWKVSYDEHLGCGIEFKTDCSIEAEGYVSKAGKNISCGMDDGDVRCTCGTDHCNMRISEFMEAVKKTSPQLYNTCGKKFERAHDYTKDIRPIQLHKCGFSGDGNDMLFSGKSEVPDSWAKQDKLIKELGMGCELIIGKTTFTFYQCDLRAKPISLRLPDAEETPGCKKGESEGSGIVCTCYSETCNLDLDQWIAEAKKYPEFKECNWTIPSFVREMAVKEQKPQSPMAGGSSNSVPSNSVSRVRFVSFFWVLAAGFYIVRI